MKFTSESLSTVFNRKKAETYPRNYIKTLERQINLLKLDITHKSIDYDLANKMIKKIISNINKTKQMHGIK